MVKFFGLIAACWLANAALVFAQSASRNSELGDVAVESSSSVGRAKAADASSLVAQNLLRLVHTPEVQTELELSATQIERLEEFFEQSDGIWFRSRILPPEKQRTVLADLESRLKGWLAKNASGAQRQRLQQIELRSLGVRMLLRPDVAQQLQISDVQKKKFIDLARTTEDATVKLQQASMRGESPEELKTALLAASQAEQSAVPTTLRPEQLQKLSEIMGEPFDTASLERIYPMAPEFAPGDAWINSQPQRLKDLRGKVVVVHFYAFQCHNCHANFGHYNKWHEKFPSDQVVVVGIQTPETSRERDPDAVRAAAKERGFQFPVILDMQSENWKAWSNTMWPTVYIIDKQGYIRFWWQGELNWQGATHDKTIQDLIERLIAEDTIS